MAKAKTQFRIEGDVGYVKMFSKRHGEVIALVDAWRMDEIRDRGWFVSSARKYAMDAYGVVMHKALFPCEKGFVRDHINGNGFDNRESNIRIVTQQDNCFNRKERKYKPGVNKHTVTGKYSAILRVGIFDTEDEAHEAWCRAYQAYLGTLPECVS